MPEVGFEAEVRGAFARSVQGAAAEDSLGGVGAIVDLGMNVPAEAITALRLQGDGGDNTFYIVGTTEGDLVPGTYPIERAGHYSFDADRTRFVVLYRYDDDNRSVAFSTSGTFTVTAVTDDAVAGSFAFDALILDEDVKDEDAEPDLSVEGDFRAEMRRRSVGDR